MSASVGFNCPVCCCIVASQFILLSSSKVIKKESVVIGFLIGSVPNVPKVLFSPRLLLFFETISFNLPLACSWACGFKFSLNAKTYKPSANTIGLVFNHVLNQEYWPPIISS